MTTLLRLTTLTYPSLCFSAWFIQINVEMTAPEAAALRLALGGLLLVLVLQLASSAALGADKGAVLTAIVVTAAAVSPRLALVGLIGVCGITGWLIVRRLRGHAVSLAWPLLTRRLSLVALALVVSGAALFGAERLNAPALVVLPPLVASPGTDTPDIVIVVLDGYPRADTLLDQFGYDNGPFLESLEARGFEVAQDSRSNYTRTELVFASLLNAAHIPDLLRGRPVPEEEDDQRRLIFQALDHARGVEALERAGYQSTFVSGGVPNVDVQAHRTHRSGALTTYEIQALRHTTIGTLAAPVLRAVAGSAMRAHVYSGLEGLGDATAGADPAFVFAHVLSPHAPFVFERDGAAREPEQCFPTICDLIESTPSGLKMTNDSYASAYANQTEYLNTVVLDAVDDLLAADPTTVIVLLSDHGSRHDLDGDPDEAFRTLFASHTPGAPGLFGDSPTPVNVLPLLINEYLGGAIDLLPSTQYRSEPGSLLTIEAVSPSSRGPQ